MCRVESNEKIHRIATVLGPRVMYGPRSGWD